MPSTGEQLGAGIYTCDYCGEEVILYDDNETLSACPNCEGTDLTLEDWEIMDEKIT